MSNFILYLYKTLLYIIIAMALLVTHATVLNDKLKLFACPREHVHDNVIIPTSLI